MKETYVTGARGFLGRHLTSKLDAFRAVPYEEIDSTNFYPFDRLFFLSAYGNMAYHTEDGAVVKANVLDIARILSQIDFSKGFDSFHSLIYVSSSSVKLPTQTLYSRSKNAAEQLLLAFAEKYNAPICIVRPFSITGVGEQPEHLIPKLIRSCLEGEVMDFVEEPVHDFIDVEDVVSGILALSKNRQKGIFELGTGVATSNLEVLHTVEQVTGKKANVRRVKNMRTYDYTDWFSVNFKARSYGWMPKKTLKDSVTEMVEAYKDERLS